MGFRLSCMRFVNMIITTNPSLDNRIAVRNDFLALDLLVVCNKIIGDTRKSLLEESLEEKSSTPTSPSNHVNVRKSSVFTSPNGTSPTSPSGGSGDLTISVDGSEGVMGDGKATTAELLEAFTTQVEVFEGSMQEDGESIRREGGRRDREKGQGEETGRTGRRYRESRETREKRREFISHLYSICVNVLCVCGCIMHCSMCCT